MSYSHLTRSDRDMLAALLRAGHKQDFIASQLGRHPSTISRELSRNSHDAIYTPAAAQTKTNTRRLEANQRFRKIEHDPILQRTILQKLFLQWSPEQIAGRCQRISHEAIYQWVDTRPELKKLLRCKKGKYRRQYGTRLREKRREEAKKQRIDTRPSVVETRIRIGDWEGDTMIGTDRKTRLLTLVDRKSGYTIVKRLTNVTAQRTAELLQNIFVRLPKHKQHTLTLDNGTEFQRHEDVMEQTDLPIYFAYPYHSWERGTNENTNGLLRQYFPKKTSFENITEEQIYKAMYRLNNRPRKRLHFSTPSEVFHGKVAL